MKIGIIGSATSMQFPEFVEHLDSHLNTWFKDLGSPEVCTSSTGEFSKRVADILSKQGISVTLVEADYKKFGKAASYMRMKSIVDMSDRIYLYEIKKNGKNWRTAGVKTAFRYALKQGKEVDVWSLNI